MSNPIHVHGLVKTFGQIRALDGLDLDVAAGRGARLPRAERGRQVHHDPGAARPAAGRRRRRSSCSAATRGATRPRCTGGSPTCPATWRCGRTCPAARRSTCWAGCAAAWHGRAPRAELLERFELDPRKKGRAYSKGNRQKVALVAALASDVELLLLDEPTSGLDPLMEEVFQRVHREERERGRTVLLSSHILAEVEALCDRVSIMRAGRTVETGTLAELRHLPRTSIRAELAGAPAGLADLPGVHDLRVRGRRVRLRGRHRRARRGPAAGSTDARRAQPGQPAADAGGVVPAPLRGASRRGMIRLAGTGTLVRLALRRDRVLPPVGAGRWACCRWSLRLRGDRSLPHSGRAGGVREEHRGNPPSSP